MRRLVLVLGLAGCFAAPGPVRQASVLEARTRAAADSLRRALAPGYSDALLAVDRAAMLQARMRATPGASSWLYPQLVRVQDSAIQGLTMAFAQRTEEAQLLRRALQAVDSARR